MSRKSAIPQSRRHILVFDEDWEYLESQYGRPYGVTPLGTSAAVRLLIHKYVRKLKAREEEALSEPVDNTGES